MANYDSLNAMEKWQQNRLIVRFIVNWNDLNERNNRQTKKYLQMKYFEGLEQAFGAEYGCRDKVDVIGLLRIEFIHNLTELAVAYMWSKNLE